MSNDEEKAKRRGDGTVATNRKANHDFAIGETYTCGIELMGPEVKSLRLNTASIAEAFARVDENLELWLYGMHINQYKFSREVIDPIRPRRLLAHKKEIIQMSIKGNTPKFDIGKKLKNIHLMILKCCKNFITKILNWC